MSRAPLSDCIYHIEKAVRTAFSNFMLRMPLFPHGRGIRTKPSSFPDSVL